MRMRKSNCGIDYRMYKKNRITIIVSDKSTVDEVDRVQTFSTGLSTAQFRGIPRLTESYSL